MDLTRRDFLRVAGASTVAGVLFAGCAIPEREIIKQSPRDLPEDLAQGLEDWYATACGACMEGHGIIVRVSEGRAKKIEGNPDHPLNRGRLMVGCVAGVQALYHPDRLTGPTRDGSAISWQQGMDRLTQLIRDTNASRTVLITQPNRGHLGAVAKDFSAATGIQHLQLEPLEQTVLRAAVSEVFGQDRLPLFDIANTDTILSIGADFLESWVAPVHYSRAYGEFRRPTKPGRSRGTLIHASSRFSMTAANADTWLPIAPGQEGLLALSVAYVLVNEGLSDSEMTARMTGGRGAAALESFAPGLVADRLGITHGVITADMITEVARKLGAHKRALVIAGGAAAAHSNGLFNVRAALLLNGLLGNVGHEGGVKFNPVPPVEELRNLPAPASYADWKSLRDRLNGGGVDLVLVDGANPAHTLAQLGFGDALGRAQNVVSFSSVPNDTTALASLILPDQNYLESWGSDVPEPGPGYPVLTVQQPVAAPLLSEDRDVVYDSRSFGDVLLTAGTMLNLSGARFRSGATMETTVRDALRRLHEANPGRGSVQGSTLEAFTVGVLQRGGWWDVNAESTNWASPPRVPAFGVSGDRVHDPESGTYHLVPFANATLGNGVGSSLPWVQSAPDPITSMVWQSWVEVNSREAARLGLRDGDLVELTSDAGSVEAPVYLHPGIPPNVVSVPLGRGHVNSGRYSEDSGVNILTVLSDTSVADTGGHAWAATSVEIRPLGRRVRMPRMEGGFTGQQLEGAHVIELTSG